MTNRSTFAKPGSLENTNARESQVLADSQFSATTRLPRARRPASLLIALLSLTQTSFVVVPSALLKQVETNSSANQSNVQPTPLPDELKPGNPVERKLTGDESHSHLIALLEGQYLYVTVDQRGINVVVALQGPDGKLAKASEIEKAAKEFLSVMLLSPVASILGKKRLVIVPDGTLQYLPFAALADPSKKAKWEPLILRHEIVSLSSASTLAIQRRELDGRYPAPKTAVVVADPVFSADDARVKRRQYSRPAGAADSTTNRAVAQADAVNRIRAGSDASITEPAKAGQTDTGKAQAGVNQNSGEHDEPLCWLALKRAIHDARRRTARDGLLRLLGTRREREAIVALVGANQSKLIVDFAATRAAAESNEMSQYRYVLFATHGLIDSKNPELSALVLSLVDEQGRHQDGFLRTHQIFNLNLPAEVVVLSACQTGLGKDVRGEGLVGLTRGFMYAGAKLRGSQPLERERRLDRRVDDSFLSRDAQGGQTARRGAQGSADRDAKAEEMALPLLLGAVRA
jgi:CHAT domain-containing protein